MENEIIPPGIKGKNTDLEETITLDSREEALLAFKRACNRMLNPDIWQKLCGPATADFRLTGAQGEEATGLAQEGDYFKIDIPGPGPSKGDGYDWVRVEKIKHWAGDNEESCGMKVRASSPPGEAVDETAHFFKEDATSSFVVHRRGNMVTASYHGRNELPNTGTGSITDNVRNSMVAMGAVAGLSALQWSLLVKGFLEKDPV